MYNTLLELYLGEIGSCPPSVRVTKERKALELLKRPEVHVYLRVEGKREERRERGGREGRKEAGS